MIRKHIIPWLEKWLLTPPKPQVEVLHKELFTVTKTRRGQGYRRNTHAGWTTNSKHERRLRRFKSLQRRAS